MRLVFITLSIFLSFGVSCHASYALETEPPTVICINEVPLKGFVFLDDIAKVLLEDDDQQLDSVLSNYSEKELKESLRMAPDFLEPTTVKYWMSKEMIDSVHCKDMINVVGDKYLEKVEFRLGKKQIPIISFDEPMFIVVYRKSNGELDIGISFKFCDL